MKRFLIKLLPFVIWIFLLMVVVPVAIDPYNVFHVENIRDNGIEPNKNFLKTEYVIDVYKRQAYNAGAVIVNAVVGKGAVALGHVHQMCIRDRM